MAKGVVGMVIGLALLGVVAGGYAQEPLRVGYVIAPPYSFQHPETGEPTGIAVEYFRTQIAPHLNRPIVFEVFPLARLLQRLTQGKIDAALFLGRNSSREQLYIYAARPYMVITGGLVVRQDSPLHTMRAVEDLLPFTIGVIKEVYKSPLMRDPRLTYHEVAPGTNAVSVLLKKVHARRDDAAYLPALHALQFTAHELGLHAALRYLRLPEDPQDVYTVFRKDISPALVERYNRANTTFFTHDELTQLSEHYSLTE